MAKKDSQIENETYIVWVKHTGNPTKLSFNEWKLLKNAKVLIITNENEK
jgi:hypothetical protein